MTNGEKYRDELLEIQKFGESVALLNGKPVACRDIENCVGCDLEHKNCGTLFWIKWMLSEYQEPPTINQAEYDYLSFVNRVYGEDALVYRGASDYNIMILYAIDKNSLRDCFSANTYENAFVRKYNRRMLPFIDDKTTMTVGELLKLEVVD